MEAITLPLFNPELTTQVLAQPVVKPSFTQPQSREEEISYHPQKSLETTLEAIFPHPQEESKLARARRILGEVAKDQTDEQLQTFLTEAQYLIDSWLDDFERQVFDGVTLKQVLRGE